MSKPRARIITSIIDDFDTETRTIAGRPYVIRFAQEIEKGEAVWTQAQVPGVYELWHVTNVQTFAGFTFLGCKEGSIQFASESGVYVDVRKGR